MATRILGLDIQEEQLCAVVVEQLGSEQVILSCASLEIDGVDQIAAVLPELLQQLDSYAGSCVLGLPLSIISLRNLALPFTDRKKMRQVLPLELEEQFLRPMGRQVIDFRVTGKTDSGSSLLVAALKKEYLQTFLPVLEKNDLLAKAVLPAISSLAREHLQGSAHDDPALFLYAGTHAMCMALWADDRVVFMRRIAYPEQVFTESSIARKRGLPVLNPETAKVSIARICNTIKSSLSYFEQESGIAYEVKTAVLSGCVIGENWWYELIGQELALKVTASALQQERAGIRLSQAVQERWNPYRYDSALALALTGLKKKKQSADLNFLQGEFAPGPQLLLTKRSLLAAASVFTLVCVGILGYLWGDYRVLDSRSSKLLAEMETIFKQTFPEVTNVRDPYVQMQSKLKEVKTSDVSIPLFSGEKRALDVLADISGRIPENVSLHVSRLVIDQEAVQIKGTTDAYNNVDVIKNKLSASSRYTEVKIVSATADKKEGSIRFEIRLQLVESS